MNIQDLKTAGDIISYGIVITIEGILVVFLILILIMLTIYAMSSLSGDKKKKEPAKPASEPVIAEESADDVDEYELIAVLTAAVAVCMGTNSSSINIKSYKKVSSAWGNAAKREILENRF